MIPDVSIVMINHNGSRWLREAVDSCLAQEEVAFELVVTDDASTDDSPAILRKYAERDPRVRPVFIAENVGISEARNLGIEAARGTYIAIFDSDDRMLPHTIGSMRAHFQKLREGTPDLVLLTTDAWLINERGVRWGRYMSREWWDRIATQEPPFWTLPSTWFFERSVPVRFFKHYRSADALYFMRRMQAIGSVGFVGEPLIEYRLRLSSVSNAKGANMVREMNATHASVQTGRLMNPLRPEEVEPPTWRQVARWRHGRNAKAYAANGHAVRSAFEASLAGIADPRVTWAKIREVHRQRHLRKQRLGLEGGIKLPTWTRWAAAVVGLALVIAVEQLSEGVTIAPLLGLSLLVALALLLRPRQLLPVALAYAVAVAAILFHRASLTPEDSLAFDRAVVRSLSFLVAAAIAVLTSALRVRLSSSVRELVQVLESVPAPILVSGPEGLIVFANDAAGRLLGRPSGELPGRDHASLLQPSGSSARADYPAMLARAGESTVDFQLAGRPDLGPLPATIRTTQLGRQRFLLTLLKPGGATLPPPANPQRRG